MRETGMAPVDVMGTPLKAKGGEVACAITGAKIDGGILRLSKGQSHRLSFRLADGNIPGLTFVPENEDPFCSYVDDCPDEGDQVPQFPTVNVTDKGRTLTVVANPGTEDMLHYALRLTNGRRTLTFDPIIINE